MNRSLMMLLMLLIGLLSSSCTGKPAISTNSPVQTISPSETSTSVVATNTPHVDKENPPTNVPTITDIPTITPTPTQTSTHLLTRTPKKTPNPTTEAQATIEAFGSLCSDTSSLEISPDGKWIAAVCYEDNSHLRVMSIDRSKDWSIVFADYVNGGDYDRRDRIIPYRWSTDGRFLYAVAHSKGSGCCWLGNYKLLVRLNLETGDQVDILNILGSGIPAISFAISNHDRYLIYVSPRSDDELVIQDLLTWETREIAVEFQNELDADYVLLSPDLDKIILTLFRVDADRDDVFPFDSIGLIDLTTGEQKKLVSNSDKPLYPYQWVDADHVLLTTTRRYRWNDLPPENEFWLLNIQTAELTKVENP